MIDSTVKHLYSASRIANLARLGTPKAEHEIPIEFRGTLVRLSVHEQSPYCLAVVSGGPIFEHLLRISRQNYAKLVGSIRKPVLCQPAGDGLWSIETELPTVS